jgi:flagellar hook-length control protein FliK
VRITSTGAGQGTAEIDLRHPELGRVRLELTLVGGALEVVAMVGRSEAAEAIGRSEGEIRLSLAAQGIELKSLRIQTVNSKKKTPEPSRSRQGRAHHKEDKA